MVFNINSFIVNHYEHNIKQVTHPDGALGDHSVEGLGLPQSTPVLLCSLPTLFILLSIGLQKFPLMSMGGRAEASSVRRPRSEYPHRCERKFVVNCHFIAGNHSVLRPS